MDCNMYNGSSLILNIALECGMFQPAWNIPHLLGLVTWQWTQGTRKLGINSRPVDRISKSEEVYVPHGVSRSVLPFSWLALQSWWALAAFKSLIYSQSVGLLGRMISSSQGLYQNTGQHKHRINTYTHQTSMPWVGFEPTITASEWARQFMR
jgi:hypothetical protein